MNRVTRHHLFYNSIEKGTIEQMRNIVFYSKSKGDQYSPRLFEILKAMPKGFQSEFIYYCIDPDPLTKKRNDDVLHLMGVTEVPTMIVSGEKYVGNDAFQWLLMQYNQLQGGGMPPGAPPGMSGVYDEPYPPQGQHQPTMAEMMQMQQGGMTGIPPGMSAMPPGMMPGMQQALPGMPQMPQMGGFAAMRPGMMGGGMGGGGGGGPLLPGDGNAGSGGPRGGLFGGSGGGGDSAFADPFAPTDITGINACGLSPEQILTPIQTKNQDNSGRMDYLLEKYAKERDAMVPISSQTIPGMGMSMAQMQMPQMQQMQQMQMRR